MKTLDSILNSMSLGGAGKSTAKYLVLQLMKLRNSRGITQNQLAKEINVSHTTIARIENFSMQPTLNMLLQILSVYDMTLEIVPRKQGGTLLIMENNQAEENETRYVVNSKKMMEVVRSFSKINSLVVDAQTDYSKFLNKLLSSYVDAMVKHDISSNVIKKVSRFNKYINIVLSEYFCGRHDLAYDIFKESLSVCIDLNCFMKEMSNNSVLYRARKKRIKKYTSKEMFHVPFENRYKVSTQRYSFPGLPCLYLGGSPEICATELNENISNLSIARLVYREINKNYRIMDLTSLFFDYFAGTYETNAEKFLENFPLVLICSTYIDYGERSDVYFKKEYIIPQLLLEYIMNESILKANDVIGIKYFSVRENFIEYFMEGNFYDLQKISNYVFPARDAKSSEGYCQQLENMFDVVEVE